MGRHHHHIALNTDKTFFYPGEDIHGTIIFIPKKAVNLHFVKAVFSGREICNWGQKIATRTGAPMPPSDKLLFTRELALVTERGRFEVQTHTWPIHFTVPRNIPPSCNFKRQTKIYYSIKITASTGFGHFDVHCKVPILIGQVWAPIVPTPVSKTYTINRADNEFIRLEAVLLQPVASCGDVIKCEVQFRNTSYKNIVGLRMKLKQQWECEDIMYHKSVVSKTYLREGFPIGYGNEFRTISLTVPDLLLDCPTVTNASLFKCHYYVVLQGITKMVGIVDKGCVKLKMPIVISRTEHSSPISDESTGTPIVSPTGSPVLRSRARSAANSRDAALNDVLNDLNSISSWTSNSINGQGQRRMPTGSAARSAGEVLGLADLESSDEEEETLTRPRSVSAPTITEDGEHKDGDHKDDAKKSEDIKDVAEEIIADELRKSLSSGGECIICFDGPKNILLLPCAHIATCKTCTSQLMKTTKVCPVCRARVTQVVRTYRV